MAGLFDGPFWGSQPLSIQGGSLETASPEERLAQLRAKQEQEKASAAAAQSALAGSTENLARQKAEVDKREAILRELVNSGDQTAIPEWKQTSQEAEILNRMLPGPPVAPPSSGRVSPPPSTHTGAGTDLATIQDSSGGVDREAILMDILNRGAGVPGYQEARTELGMGPIVDTPIPSPETVTAPSAGYIEWTDPKTGEKRREPVGTGLSGIQFKNEVGESGRQGGFGYATAGPAVEEAQAEELQRQSQLANLYNELYMSQRVPHPFGAEYGTIPRGAVSSLMMALEELRQKQAHQPDVVLDNAVNQNRQAQLALAEIAKRLQANPNDVAALDAFNALRNQLSASELQIQRLVRPQQQDFLGVPTQGPQ